jgi:hypothetical protein
VIVEEVNGRRAGTLADVKKALATPAGGFHIFKLAPGQGTSRIVLDAQETATAESRVRKLYNLPGKAGSGADVVGTLPARE